jgi:phospholipid transport system substrate-binding protein
MGRNMSVFLVLVGTALMSIPVFAGGYVQPDFSAQSQRTFYMNVAESRDLEKAKTFIDGLSREGIAFLKDKALGEEARRAAFKKLLVQNFDIQKIGRFTMGRYWRTASSQQKNRYQMLFKDMIVDVYSKRFSDYKGQTLSVGQARLEGSKDIVVSSKLTGTGEPEVAVEWRVRPVGKSFKVIDVVVEGVSMALTQRSEFASVIQRGGGSVDVLIAHLEQRQG